MDTISIVLTVALVFVLALYVHTLRKLKLITDAFAKLFVLYNTSQSEEVTKEDYDVHRESFIKFLSDSREWAFSYIEEVQSGLKKFIDNVEPELEYYNQYGAVVEGMIPPHDNALKKISQEFIDLKRLLPEETNDRR